MADPTKTCTKCGEERPVTDFKIRKQRGREYRMGRCLPCERAYQRGWKNKKYAQSDPEVERFRRIKTLYGITREQYIDMMLGQDFRCALCGDPVEAYGFVVDHDHETGRVRGLLHQGCNTGLGKLGDSIEGLMKAIAYLEAHHAKS